MPPKPRRKPSRGKCPQCGRTYPDLHRHLRRKDSGECQPICKHEWSKATRTCFICQAIESPPRPTRGAGTKAWGLAYKGKLLGSAWPIDNQDAAIDDACAIGGKVVPVLITEQIKPRRKG